MREPVQCALWRHPELADGPMQERFELLETYIEESHWWRYLLRCRECGQRYFFEFYEQVDWDSGNDPQHSTYIPVDGEDEIRMLRQASPLELLRFFPRLQHDFPKEAERPTTRWTRG
jgi:hypothetical protein